METKSSTFFEVTARYDSEQKDGSIKKVSETFSIDALSFTEAEKAMIKELDQYRKSYLNYEITAIKKAQYKEIFLADDDTNAKYYNAVLSFISVKDVKKKNGKHESKEIRTKVDYLVEATSINAAIKSIDAVMKNTQIDYESVAVKESKIVDVLLHGKD